MTREDPLDVLERIHRDVKLLGELAGPAIRVTIEAITPPPQRSDEGPPVERSQREHRQDRESDQVREARAFAERVAAHLREHGPQRQVDLARAFGVNKQTLVDALKRLGTRVEKGPEARGAGQTTGRGSPVWSAASDDGPDPARVPDAGPERGSRPLVVSSAIKPRIIECVRNLDRPTFGAIVRELYPGAKLSRNIQPAKAVAALIAAMEDAGELFRDGTYRGGAIYRLAPAAPTPADPAAEPETPALSPRTRKSIERAQADERAAAALGEPPESRVFELLRGRNLTIREIAAELGEHQAVVAEEVHGLRPWLDELHSGKLRVVERYRQREAA